MNEVTHLTLNKENFVPFTNKRGKGNRVFGKEIQNVRPGEVTPNQKASRVNGDITPKIRERTVSIVESFTLKPQHVEEYQMSILRFLQSKEEAYKVPKDYLSLQKEINSKMRGILIDWLVDVNGKFKLLPQCLFMTVNLLDRFLAKQELLRSQLQLAGITCLMIVCKFEEIYPPMLKDFVAVCDNAYSKREILDMEASILHTIDFDLCQSSTFAYLKFFNLKLQMEDKMFVYARYLLENALQDVNSLKHTNWSLAAAAIFLVNKIFKKDGWTEDYCDLTGVSEEQVKLPAKDLFIIMHKADSNGLTAVKRKFAEPAYFEVSKYKIEKGGQAKN